MRMPTPTLRSSSRRHDIPFMYDIVLIITTLSLSVCLANIAPFDYVTYRNVYVVHWV